MISTFGSFAVPDIEAARAFYGDVLGLKLDWVQSEGGPLWVHGTGEEKTLVYPKSDHAPANFTVLHVQVPDIGGAVDELTSRGVTFERYDDPPTDERGISREGGLSAAWCTDPAGNIVGIVQM